MNTQHNNRVSMNQISTTAHAALDFIRQHELLSPRDDVLVALSGGPDSVALLCILHELSATGALPLNVSAAHLNHNLRGEESRGDADFCDELTDNLGIPLISDSIRVDAQCRAGESLEEAARRVRYGFLARAAHAHGIPVIAVGHHADDQAETVLLHLTRGCGLNGLSGMPARRRSHHRPHIDVIRPLLPLRRKTLRGYLEDRGQSFRVDSSNANTAYRRNHIRHKLIPFLNSRIDGELVEHLTQTARHADEINGELREIIDARWSDLCTDAGCSYLDLDINQLRNLDPELQKRAVRRVLRSLAPSAQELPDLGREHYREITRLSHAGVGKSRTLPGDFTLRREHGLLHCEYGQASRKLNANPLPVPGVADLPAVNRTITTDTLSIKASSGSAYVARSTPQNVYLSRDEIRFPLTVRSRRDGDRFYPLGAPGTRKLKDYFIDKKVPHHRRDMIPLVVDADNCIIWVAGHEIAHHCRIRQDSTDLIHLVLSALR